MVARNERKSTANKYKYSNNEALGEKEEEKPKSAAKRKYFFLSQRM